ncbi:hypothetical protein E4U57_004156 [Claviceps arundinis]|uniref:Uncharacterized protein n=1 Tax=Claviceps arundinis TaxID=1623583 RepID=A0ABQ7P5M1_9HYPO|nr:hypothetical protein E4U57_004156 [Claviceps arundinis]
MSVHVADTAQNWVRFFANCEGPRATWTVSLLLGTRDPVYLFVEFGHWRMSDPIFAPATGTPEFGSGTTSDEEAGSFAYRAERRIERMCLGILMPSSVDDRGEVLRTRANWRGRPSGAAV